MMEKREIIIINNNSINLKAGATAATTSTKGTNGLKKNIYMATSMMALMSQGIPRHSSMSNVFDPMLLLMAMLPLPCLETMRLEMTSGMEVPTARKVRPITESGMLSVNPITVIIQVST